jgi:hypothetical protein
MAPYLRRLWVGMLTRNEEDAGTDSQIALTVMEDSADRLYHLSPDTSQNDQERGQPNLYEVPEELVLSAKISPERYVEAGVDSTYTIEAPRRTDQSATAALHRRRGGPS